MILYFHPENASLYNDYQSKIKLNIPAIGFKEVKLKLCFVYIGYVVLLIAAFLGCASQFRVYWKLIGLCFLPGTFFKTS